MGTRSRKSTHSTHTMYLMQVWCTLLLAVTVSCYKTYHGYKVLRTGTLDKTSADLLREAQVETNLDFWKEPAPGRFADIMTSPSEMDSVMAWLSSNGISYHTMVEDVEQLIQESKPRNNSSLRSAGKRYAMDWMTTMTMTLLTSLLQLLLMLMTS